jgi:Spy/CpxP family protein refolding chaperone
MEKFVMTQEKKRVNDRWKKEADAVASDWDQLSEIEEVEEMDPYERELEEMIRREEEELEALIKEISI